MWLVRCFEDGVSQRRIFGLFRQGEGVPTSLRGLHAWLAHFSDVLATPCIDADPYAVLRYGDAETVDLSRGTDPTCRIEGTVRGQPLLQFRRLG